MSLSRPAARSMKAALVSCAVIAAGCCAAPASARVVEHVNDCWTDDNGPVVLDSVSFSPSAVDVTQGPAHVEVRVQAHDTGGPGPATGIARVSLAAYPLRPLVLHLSGGAWVGTLTIPKGWPDGSRAGNIRGDIIATDGGGRVTDLDANGPDGYAVAVTDSAPDRAAPVLKGLRISKDHLDTTDRAESVKLVAKVVDEGSGVRSVRFGYDEVSTRLTLVPGTHRFRGWLVVPRWQGKGAEKLVGTLTDRLGNSKGWGAAELRAAGFDSGFQLRSGPPDEQPPHLDRVVSLTRHVDVRHHNGSVLLKVALSDNRGVSRASAGLGAPLFGREAILHRVSGTPRRGVWVGTISVSRCGHDGSGVGGVQVNIADAAHHVMGYGAGLLHARALHRQGFVVQNVLPSAGATLRFKEPVHGISTDNVVVGNEPALAGAWTCSGHSGSVVSCLTGAVRTAEFTPADPATFNADQVDLEPAGHLGVLDRYGNPAFNNIVSLGD